MRYRFFTCDVFTDTRFGGNPLAVFPDAQGLSGDEMQKIAREFNISETTFVLPPKDEANTAQVRIFNPTAEMPFAGHPNVGTGFALAALNRDHDGVLLFEEIAGLVEVRVNRDASGALAGTTIAAPQPLSLAHEMPVAAVAECAGLEPSDVITTAHRPVLASVGNPFYIAEVTGAALSRANPEWAAFRKHIVRLPASVGSSATRLSLYLYAKDSAKDGARIRTRMFAPLAGIVKDPATGSAATPLGALLLSLSGETQANYDIVQGVEMGRPSRLYVTARKGEDGIRATVGGGCVTVMRGEIAL
jgi:trans-2,3-dihydro-3-hydroxyanthranilate isomerase